MKIHMNDIPAYEAPLIVQLPLQKDDDRLESDFAIFYLERNNNNNIEPCKLQVGIKVMINFFE